MPTSSSSSSAPDDTSTETSKAGDGNSSETKDNHAGAIAGGVVGGVAGLALLALVAFLLLRKRRRGPLEGFDNVSGQKTATPYGVEGSLSPNRMGRPDSFTGMPIGKYLLSFNDSSSCSLLFLPGYSSKNVEAIRMYDRMQDTERALSDLETRQSLTERSGASATSPMATSPAEIIGLSEQIRSLRQETEHLRRQQHDILQAVTDAPPPMYVVGGHSESDHDHAC